MGLTEIRTYTKNRGRGRKSPGTSSSAGDADGDVDCFGTAGRYKIWFNTSDISGLALASVVWSLILYSLVITFLIATDSTETAYQKVNACIVMILILMALWSHAATMCGDPGVVPPGAKPLGKNVEDSAVQCGMCENYKPPGSHHDRVSGRCISRMDHFCPWTNNAIGAKNQKNFFLFLIYTNIASFYLYIILFINLGTCNALSCNPANLLLIQIEAVVLLFAVVFTSSMIITQIYCLVTGLGTIDRMQLKRGQADSAEPVPFEHVFGEETWRWFVPVDPVFKEPDVVYQYRIPEYTTLH